MAIIKKIREVISGKTDIERKQEKAATDVIRKEVMAAQLRERRQQAINYAIEAEKIKYQQKIKQLKQSKPTFRGFNVQSPEYRNYGSIISSPRFVKQRAITKYVGKGKKRKKVKRIVRTAPQYRFGQMAQQSSGWDVLGI